MEKKTVKKTAKKTTPAKDQAAARKKVLKKNKNKTLGEVAEINHAIKTARTGAGRKSYLKTRLG